MGLTGGRRTAPWRDGSEPEAPAACADTVPGAIRAWRVQSVSRHAQSLPLPTPIPPQLQRGDQLEPIPPRVVHMEAALAGNLRVVRPSHRHARCGERRGKLLKGRDRVDEQRRVRSCRRVEWLLDTDVELVKAGREPTPTAPREQRRLLDLSKAEQPPVERPGLGLAAWRYRDLHVVQADDRSHRLARPSYSGRVRAPTARKVMPPSPPTMTRVESGSTRR